MKLVRHFTDMIIHGPGRAVRGIGNGSVTKYTNFRSNLHTVMNWRTPTTRPAVPDPTDPEVLSQLHSTRWTTDLSPDKEAMRTRRLLNAQSWAWLPHIFLIPGLTVVWVIYQPTGRWTYDALTFSTLWRFMWVLSIPNCLFAWFGFITPDSVYSQETMDKKPIHREYIRNFFIVLVTKGSNEAAVRRGYNKLLKLEKYHPSVKVVVLTDEPYVYPDLQNVVCPKSYKSPLGASLSFASLAEFVANVSDAPRQGQVQGSRARLLPLPRLPRSLRLDPAHVSLARRPRPPAALTLRSFPGTRSLSPTANLSATASSSSATRLTTSAKASFYTTEKASGRTGTLRSRTASESETISRASTSRTRSFTVPSLESTDPSS